MVTEGRKFLDQNLDLGLDVDEGVDEDWTRASKPHVCSGELPLLDPKRGVQIYEHVHAEVHVI